MLRKPIFALVSGTIFVIGAILCAAPANNMLIGAWIGNSMDHSLSLLGFFLISISIILFILGENLEYKIKTHGWKKYPLNEDSVIRDVEQGYLKSKDINDITPMQRKIEESVHGKPIHTPNRLGTYYEQFYEGHASQGGRIIDVESHISHKGEYKGKLVHFGQPANARYLWIVDEDGNFIVANRQTYIHDMDSMNNDKIDVVHRHHKLPHATVARGKRILGSGEVLVEGGKIKSYNAASGHYIDIMDIDSFNTQGKAVFEYFMKKVGWKEVGGGARYEIKH